MIEPVGELRGFTYHVVGGNSTIDTLMQSQGARQRGIEFADLVIFQGGTDVNPFLYSKERHAQTQDSDFMRDRMEIATYQALDKNQWKVGICRGAQFLHIMNGGKLWQHVEGHRGPHQMMYKDKKDQKHVMMVSSTHHQMMFSSQSIESLIWGWATETKFREFPNGRKFPMSSNHWRDAEIIYYPETRCLCFQPHPEYTYPKETRVIFCDCLNRMVES